MTREEEEASLFQAASKTDLDIQLALAQGWVGFKLRRKPQNIGMPSEGGNIPRPKAEQQWWWKGYPFYDFIEHHRSEECPALYEHDTCDHSPEDLLKWVPRWSEDPGHLFAAIQSLHLSTHHEERAGFWVVSHPRDHGSSEAQKFYTGTTLPRALMRLLIDMDWTKIKRLVE